RNAHRMASLTSLHVFLPLSIVFFFFCSHEVAAHRKLNLNKQLPTTNNRVLMSSSTFYNAFDTNNPNAFDATHTNFNHYASSKEGASVNYDNSASKFNDIVDSEFNANSYTNTHGNNDINTNGYTNSYRNNANQPLSTSNTQQANGAQHGFPTAFEFSSPSSSTSTSTPSLYGDKFPSSFEASLPDAQNGYSKQSFPSNDQQGFYGSHDAKSFFYTSPSMGVDAPSLSKEQSLSQSSANSYEASYNPFHEVDELKSNNHASEFRFKNEKPVTNYDSFFNSPTIHKSEVGDPTTSSPFGAQKFPLSDHDLTYGHVQVP
ncbi:hypothetical protein GOP47_0006782, partial [Adiantum capillus-veneris]